MNSCRSSLKGKRRTRTGHDALMAELSPKVEHWQRQGPPWSPCLLPVCREQKYLSFAHQNVWGPWGVLRCRQRAGRVPCGWEVDASGGLLFSLVPSACAVVICSNAALYQTHLCNLIFCISVCLFLYITSTSFLYQIIIIIFKHLCFFCSIWIFAQTYWTP